MAQNSAAISARCILPFIDANDDASQRMQPEKIASLTYLLKIGKGKKYVETGKKGDTTVD